MSAADSVSPVRQPSPLPGVPVSQQEPLQMPLVPVPAAAAEALLAGSAADITKLVASAKKKKKKKKHREPAVALPDPAGASAAAAPGHSRSVVTVSMGPKTPKYQAFLFAMPACDAFSAGDREVARTMLSRWPLSGQFCWIDIFGVGLKTDWDELIAATQSSGTLSWKLTSIQESFFGHFIMSFVHLIGKRDPNQVLQEALSCPKFFMTEAAMVESLDQTLAQLQEIIPADDGKARRAGRMQAFKQKKNEEIAQKMKALMHKLTLLRKIYSSSDPHQVLMGTSLNVYDESRVMDLAPERRLPALCQFNRFVRQICDAGIKIGATSLKCNFFDENEDLIQKMAASGVTQPLADAFNRAYVKNSKDMAGARNLFRNALERACSEPPSLTHAQFCAEQRLQTRGRFTQQEFVAQLFSRVALLDLLDSWVDDYEQVLSTVCALKLGAHCFRPSQQNAVRLFFNFYYLVERMGRGGCVAQPRQLLSSWLLPHNHTAFRQLWHRSFR
jgi:hypothetical protein